MPMKISEKGLDLIAGFEGYHEALPDGRCRAYRCIIGKDKKGRPIHDGKWTIGFGCTDGVTEDLIWTRRKANEEFRKELARFENAVNRLVTVPLTQNSFDALVSFAYNCGEGALAKSSLLKKVNAGDMAGAAAEFPKWNKSRGVVVPGLIRRRADEMALFIKPDERKPDTPPDMPQTIDAPAPVQRAMLGSRTIFGVLTAFGATLAGWFKDAVAQIQMFDPLKQVASGLGLNLATVLVAITLAGLALALFARIDDAHKGKVVK